MSITGKKSFFENASGALTPKSVVECSIKYAAISDNQGIDNDGSRELVKTINKSMEDMRIFINASNGQFFVGESRAELLFRIIMNACLGKNSQGIVLGSTVEHPVTRSTCSRWSKISSKNHVLIPHNDKKGLVCSKQYSKYITKDIKEATILHTSPITAWVWI